MFLKLQLNTPNHSLDIVIVPFWQPSCVINILFSFFLNLKFVYHCLAWIYIDLTREKLSLASTEALNRYIFAILKPEYAYFALLFWIKVI